MSDFVFDLQRFASADGEGSPAPASGGQEGLPAVDTVLGGESGPAADASNSGAGNNNPGANETGTAAAPENYDFSSALQDVFGEGAELDTDVSGKFTDILHGLNATQEQAAAAAKFGMEYARSTAQAVAEQIREQDRQEVIGWGEAARKELGGKFDETVTQACTTRNYLEQKIPGFTAMLNQTGAGNHIAMIKAMAMMASLVGEDTGHNGDGAAGSGRSMYDHTDFSKY